MTFHWFSLKSSTTFKQHQAEDQAFNTQTFGGHSSFSVAMYLIVDVLRIMLNYTYAFVEEHDD